MNQKQKRIAWISILLIAILGGTLLAMKLLHIRILAEKTPSPETAFVNRNNIGKMAPNALSFNFEVDPKSGDQKGLYQGIAHSGRFSAKAFGKNTYSVTIERKAGDIGLENMKGVALSAWIYVFPGTKDLESSLVFSASNNGLNLTWQGVTLHGNEIPREKWFKISGFFNLSEITFNPDTKLQFYFWNNSANDILFDDLYVVFGGPSQRRGDSALVDMTRESSFTPRFNFPPYPFHYFLKDEISNRNSSFLVNHENLKEGEIQPSDKVIAGHFATPLQGAEDILVVKKDGNAELFVFAKEPGVFRKITTVFPANAGLKMSTILKGTFSGNNDQLLLIGENGISICTPEKINSNISSGKDKTGKQFQWKSEKILLPGNLEFKGVSWFAADLNGDKFSELLAVEPDGSWKIFSFSANISHPVVNESGKSGTIPQWSSTMMEKQITAGKFIQKYTQDLLLTIFKEKGKPGYSYTIFRFDPGSRTFISCFPEKQGKLGKTIGRDTLKPTDEFFIGNFDNSGVRKIFRYNRDWRYDLKEMRFNDTTFQVLANVDFKGFEKDHNPKYFESLRICPGTFLKPGLSSLLMIQKNPKNPASRILPETIQIYSFDKNEK